MGMRKSRHSRRPRGYTVGSRDHQGLAAILSSSVPSFQKRWITRSRFQSDTLDSAYPDRFDINLVPDSQRAIVYRQSLSRYLRKYSRSPFLQQTTILLRLMLRNHRVEDSEVGHFTPSLLHLFVLRYYTEIHRAERDDTNQAAIFRLAQNVCRQLSEFDYRNFLWCVDGDRPLQGECLRISHPVYPGHCMTPNTTSHSTIVHMRIFARLAGASTLEDFIGGSNPLTVPKI
jgi:hypothetical protein